MIRIFSAPTARERKVLTMAEYIDREAFKKSVEERYCKPCKAEGKDHNGCWCRACWVDDMLDEVDCFQPSDVAPVVHGRWDNVPNTYMSVISKDRAYRGNATTCSVCHEVNPNAYKTNYCPNCGAKMDGGMESG